MRFDELRKYLCPLIGKSIFLEYILNAGHDMPSMKKKTASILNFENDLMGIKELVEIEDKIAIGRESC
jgi:hypothetical protein